MMHKLRAELGEWFLRDHARSMEFLHIQDSGMRCVHTIPDKKRRCENVIARDSTSFAIPLRKTIRYTCLDDPAMPGMLYSYAMQCHCHSHFTTEESVSGFAKRWAEELKDVTLISGVMKFFTSCMVQRWSGKYKLDKSEVETTTQQNAPSTPHTAVGSSVETRGKDSGTPDVSRGRKRRLTQKSPSPFANGDPVFSSRRAYPRKSSTPLCELIIRSLRKKDAEEGGIYIFIHPTDDNFVKIGYTTSTKNSDSRWEKYKTCCAVAYRVHDNFFRTKNAKRVESLIHSDLYQRRAIACCRKSSVEHNELFNMSLEEAIKVVEYWVDWMKTLAPYEGFMLKPTYVRAMFVSDVLPSEAQDANTCHTNHFLQKSNQQSWLDKEILNRPGQGKSRQPEVPSPAAKVEAVECHIETPSSNPNQAAETPAEPQDDYDRPSLMAAPQEPAKGSVKQPRISPEPAVPDLDDKVAPREAVTGQFDMDIAALPWLPLPPVDNQPSLDSSPDIASSPVSSTEDTPLKHKVARKRRTIAVRDDQRRDRAESSRTPLHNALPPQAKHISPFSNTENQGTSPNHTAEENFNSQTSHADSSDDVLSPLQLPSPQVAIGDSSDLARVGLKPPQGTTWLRRGSLGVLNTGTGDKDALGIQAATRSMPNLSAGSTPENPIELRSDDEDDHPQRGPDRSTTRRASAPQNLRTPPSTGSNQKRRSSKPSTLGKHMSSVGDGEE
jgi:hypothetical protein